MLKINFFLFCAFFFLFYGQILIAIVNSQTPSIRRTNSRRLVRVKNSQPCALYSKNSRDLRAKSFQQHLSRKVRTHHGPHNHNQLTSRLSTPPKIKHHFVRKYPKSNSVDCSKRHVALESYAKRVNLTMVNGTEVSERSIQFGPIIPTLTYVTAGILKRNENQRSLIDVTTDPSQTVRENPFSANKSGLSIEELCASNGFDPKTGSDSMKMDSNLMKTESGLIQTESSSMKIDSYSIKSETTTGTGKSLKLGQHTTCVAIADDEAGGTSCYPVSEDNEVDNRKVVVNISTPGQIFAERERLLGATTSSGLTTRSDSSSSDNIGTTSTVTPSVLTPRTVLTKVFIIPIQEEVGSANLNNTLKSVRIAIDSDILNSPSKRSKSSKRTASESDKHKKQKKQHGAKDKTSSKPGKKKKEKHPSKKHDKRKKPEHKHETTTKKHKPSNKGKHEEKEGKATSSHKRKDNKKGKTEHGDKGSDQNKQKSKKHDSKSVKKKDKS